MDSNRLARYLKLVFPDPADTRSSGLSSSIGGSETREERMRRAKERAETNRRWGEHFFLEGRGNQLQGIKGTLWAAYNGIAELCDHRRTGLSAERLLTSAWFGEGYRIKAKAHKIATENMAAWLN
jgi:hypothetical protein